MTIMKLLASMFLLMTTFAVADTTVNGAKIRVLFTPGDEIAATISQAIREAKQSVHVHAFSFTNKSIARALLDVQQRRVEVNVLADREQFEKGAGYLLRDLQRGGVTVMLDGEHGAAHNKVILIDAAGANPVVITGSFNFTQAAQKYNAENVVLIYDDRTLAKAYRDNWARHWKHHTAFE